MAGVSDPWAVGRDRTAGGEQWVRKQSFICLSLPIPPHCSQYCLNHPPTPAPSMEKLSSTKPVPGARRVGDRWYVAFLTLGLNQDLLWKIEMEILRDWLPLICWLWAVFSQRRAIHFNLWCHSSCLKVCFRGELQRIPIIVTLRRTCGHSLKSVSLTSRSLLL